jgi:hypothetical protein
MRKNKEDQEKSTLKKKYENHFGIKTDKLILCFLVVS